MLVSKSRLWLSQHKEVFFPVILILGTFLSGLICGALTLHTLHSSQLEELRQYLNGFLQGVEPLAETSQASGFHAWCQILKTQLPILGIIWILGLTVVGIPLIVFVIGARGFVLGFTVGFLIKEQAVQGLLLALVAVLPQNLCYVPALICAGSIAFYFSFSLLRGYRDGPVLSGVLVYSLFFILILLLILLGTWIEAYFVPGLIRLLVSLT